jgi:CMP-N-acetylneuraminic acid synthetase
MSVVALICARGGSKGLPGKNIRLLGGRPLIAWAIQTAIGVARVGRVIVSTDSSEIAVAARDAGAEVPFRRPAELAQDTTPEWLVWRHALEFLREAEGGYPSTLIVVPTTAPLRAVSDLERCLDLFEQGDSDIVITVTDAHRNPYFNMVREFDDGTVGLVIPGQETVRRQDAPIVYDMATVCYVARPTFIMASSGLFHGRVRHVHVPAERAIDIDTSLDFRVAEVLMAQRRS